MIKKTGVIHAKLSPLLMDNHINISDLHLSNVMEDETEFIPLLSAEDEEIINAEAVPPVLPILPLRNTVLFPGVILQRRTHYWSSFPKRRRH